MPDPYLNIAQNVNWVNDHQNVSGPVARQYDVWNLWADQSQDPIPWRPGMAGLQRAIRDAAAANTTVRAYGAKWSLSPVAYCPGFAVNTKPLAVRNVGIAAANLTVGAPAGDSLFFAQCGNGIQDVHDALAAENRALKTSGASDGQTLAGAISTGTHGAANQIGAMQDSVVGIHLLVAGGEPLWLERASSPVVSEQFLGMIDTPVANLRLDDDLFNAALVSFGSFGIVHAYMIETEPLYSLVAYARRFDYDDAKVALATLDVSSLQLPQGAILPFHFEIGINPYRMGKGQQGAFVRFMYKVPGGTAAPPAPLPGGMRPGDDALGVIGTLSDLMPKAIPDLVTALMNSQLPSYENVRSTPGYAFGPTTIRGKGTSCEMGFALTDAQSALEIIAGVAQDRPFGCAIGVRYVKGSSALLAFTQYPMTCTIEIQAVATDRTLESYEEIWKRLDAAGISYSFHWGQVLPLDQARYKRIYGPRLDRWIAAKASILSPAARAIFSNDMVVGVGLE